MDIDAAIALLASERNVKFKELLAICESFFGQSRVEGSHHIFRVPWKGRPWLNIQKDKKMAKSYQVRQVKDALKKLKTNKEDK